MSEKLPFLHGKRESVLLAVVLLLAALLRFIDLDASRFNGDNAYPVWQAFDILRTGELPRVGQATLVFLGNHPSLSAYLYLPIVAAFASPLPVYIAVAFCNTMAVAGCYFAAKSIFRGDSRPAFVAAWLMAFNPWVVFYSRQIWPPGLLQFFLCTIAWLLIPVLLGQAARPGRRLFFALLLTTMMTQTTLIGFIFLAPLGLALVLFYRSIPARAMAAGTAVFAAATAIFLSGLPHGVERAVEFATDAPRVNEGALVNAVRLASGVDFAVSYGGASLPDAETRQSLGVALHYIVTGMLLAGTAAAAHAVLRRRADWKIAAVVLSWQILPVLTMSYTDTPVHLYYLLITLPAGYWLTAWGCRPLLRSAAGTAVLLGFLLVWGALMALHMVRSNQEALLQPSSANLWELPLRDALRLGGAIRAQMPAGGTVFAAMDGAALSSITEGRVTSLLGETRWPQVAIVPHNGGLYIDIADPGETAGPPPFASVAATVPLSDARTIRIYRFDTLDRPLDAVRGRIDARSEQGITLCCYELFKNQNGAWVLETYWAVEQAGALNSEDRFGVFAHVFDTDGRQIQNVEGQIVPGDHWRAGDIHVHRSRFRLEDETAFTLRVGQYDLFNNRNIIFVKDSVWTDTIEIEGVPTR